MISVIGIPLISYFRVGSSAVRRRPDCPLYDKNSSVAKLWMCARSRTLIVFPPYFFTSSSDFADLAIGVCIVIDCELMEALDLISSGTSTSDLPCVEVVWGKFSWLVKEQCFV
jgi:hypothetical protein